MDTKRRTCEELSRASSGALVFLVYEVLLRVKGLVLVPLLTRTQSLASYGLYVQAMVLVALGAAVAGFHLHVGLLRFIPCAPDREERGRVFRTFALLLIVSNILLVPAICMLGAALNPGLRDHLLLLAAVIVGETWVQLLSSFYWATERLKTFACINGVLALGDLALIAVITLAGKGIGGFLAGLLVSRLAICIVLSLKLLSATGLGPLEWHRIAEFVSFSGALLGSAVALWIVDGSDRLIIGVMLGDAWVGVYNPAYMLGAILAIACRVVVTPIAPMAARLYGAGQESVLEGILSAASKALIIIAVPYVVLLTGLQREILGMLATTGIARNAVAIAPLVSVGVALFSRATLLQEILKVHLRSAYLVKVWVAAAIVNVALNLYLIPLLGILGAAVSTLVAFGVASACIHRAAGAYINIPIGLGSLWRCAVACLPLVTGLTLLKPSGALAVWATVVTGLACYVVLLWKMGVVTIGQVRALIQARQATGQVSGV